MPSAGPEPYSAYLDRFEASLVHPLTQDGFRHWRSLLGERRFPTRADLEPTKIPRNLSQISLIDVVPQPLRFRIRLLGFHNRLHQGVVAEQDLGAVRPEQGRDRILARMDMVVKERRPIRGVYRYRPLSGTGRLIWAEVASCPFSEDGATVTGVVSFGADFDLPPPDLVEWP